MFFMKKTMSTVLVFVMLCSLLTTGLIPHPNYSGSSSSLLDAQAATSVSIGDYIQFGNYNGAPILWRVIKNDENGNPMLLSDRILTLKPFDAKGPYHDNSQRNDLGSNYYADSNIRQWLNSSSSNSGEDRIDWTQNDPSVANVWSGHNAYDDEKGFLANGNFTALERSLIKPYTHKVILSVVDSEKADDGSEVHISNTSMADAVENYDSTAYYEELTDQVFLLSVKDVKELLYDNSEVLGAGYYLAKPTVAAVSNSSYQPEHLKSDEPWLYWLNTPDGGTSFVVRNVNVDDTIDGNAAGNGDRGVRPAIVLDINKFDTWTGTGTAMNPFSVAFTPEFQSLQLSSDAKKLTAVFDETLVLADKTKITATNARNASLAINATVSGKVLSITLTDTKATFKLGDKVTIGSATVTTAYGTTNVAVAQRTLDTTKFVRLSGTTMNNTNTEATLTFATTVKSASIGSIARNPELENLSGQVETSVDGGKTWSSANVDSATVVGSTVKATFKSAVTNSKTTIRVKEGALSFTATGKGNGNLNSNVSSAALDLFPLGVSASLSANNKVLTVTYSEPIKSASADLKGKVSLSTASPANYVNLETNDNVSIKGSSLIIAFASALASTTIRVKIATGGVADARNNGAVEYTTATLAADTTGPQISAVSVGKDGKTATIFFNENITAVVSDKTKWGDFLQFSGNQGASYTPLTTPTVTVAKNSMTIRSAQSLAHGDRIKVKANAVQDVAMVKNLDDNEMVDGQDPTAETTVVTSTNRKQVVITFNEQLTTTAKAQDNTTVTAFLRSAISIKQGSTTTFLSNKSMSAVTVQLSVNGSGKTVLTISNLPADLNLSDQIGIRAGTFVDVAQRRNVLLGLPVMAFSS